MNEKKETSVAVAGVRSREAPLLSAYAVKVSRGFTLVELMTVVAIVGILGSIAIPSYHQYIIRTRVIEALLASGSPRYLVFDVAQSGRSTPAGYAATFTPPPATTNVASVAVNPVNGVITVTTTVRAGSGSIVLSPYTGTNTGLPNATAPFVPPAGAMKWQCMSAGATSIVVGIAPGTLPSRYTPPECRT